MLRPRRRVKKDAGVRQSFAGNAMNLRKGPCFTLTDCPARAKQSLTGGQAGKRKSGNGRGARNTHGGRARVSTITVADRHAGKVGGKPYWGKPDVRFDEGAEGKAVMGNWEPAAHTERGRDGNPPPTTARTEVLLYWARGDRACN